MRNPATRHLFVIGLFVLIFFATTLAEKEARLPFTRKMPGEEAQPRHHDRRTVVVFKASWCPACRQLERKTLRSAEVRKFTDAFEWVEIDIDRQLEVARKWGVQAVPQILLIDADGHELARSVGAVSSTGLARWLASVSTDAGKPPVQPQSQELLSSRLEWTPKGYRSLGLCFSHVGYGPLQIYSQSPLQSLRMGILPRTPSTLGKGQLQARANTTWANIWASDEGYFELDYETLQLSAAIAYGISDKLEIELEIQDRSRFGGAMDSLVQGFHDLFGVDQNGRDEVARGRFYAAFTGPGRTELLLGSGDRGSFSRTLQLAIQHNVTCGTETLPALSYSLTARYETLDDDLGADGGVDLGASIALAQRLGRFYIYATVGFAYFGDDSFRGIPLEKSQLTFMLAGEWRFASNHAFLVQVMQSQGVARGFGAFADDSTEVTLGWKWELLPRTVFELGLIENVLSFDNSPDFGLHIGLSRRF